MEADLFSALENKVEALLDAYAVLKHENVRLIEENRHLLDARNGLKVRIDAVLKKLDGM